MNQKGFTVIELLIVAAILGIIAAVAAPMFMDKGTNNYGATSTGVVVQEQRASDPTGQLGCTSGIAVRNGVAIKSADGTLISC